MPAKRPVGRPRGEETLVINVRISISLLHRLDRYVDKVEASTGKNVNRGMVMRNALEAFLGKKKH